MVDGSTGMNPFLIVSVEPKKVEKEPGPIIKDTDAIPREVEEAIGDRPGSRKLCSYSSEPAAIFVRHDAREIQQKTLANALELLDKIKAIQYVMKKPPLGIKQKVGDQLFSNRETRPAQVLFTVDRQNSSGRQAQFERSQETIRKTLIRDPNIVDPTHMLLPMMGKFPMTHEYLKELQSQFNPESANRDKEYFQLKREALKASVLEKERLEARIQSRRTAIVCSYLHCALTHDDLHSTSFRDRAQSLIDQFQYDERKNKYALPEKLPRHIAEAEKHKSGRPRPIIEELVAIPHTS